MVSPQLKSHFESLGVPLIPLRVGAKMLIDEVAGSAPDQVELVLGGEPNPAALNPQSGGRSFEVDVSIGKDTHPYLADHTLQGTPVVPVTLVIEWFLRAAKAFGPDLVLVRLLDLKVLRGIPLRTFEAHPEPLVVHCKQLTNENGATLALELAGCDGAVYYRCTAELAAQREIPQAALVEKKDENGTARGLALEAWGDDVVYDGDLLFHGPAFQAIQRIVGISEYGIVAELSGLREAGWTSELDAADSMWSTDPLVLDGGLQLALLWCKRALGGASLPTCVGEVRIWADAPFVGAIQCTLTGRQSKGSRSLSDLVFRDAAGNRLVELNGVETHLLPDQGRA